MPGLKSEGSRRLQGVELKKAAASACQCSLGPQGRLWAHEAHVGWAGLLSVLFTIFWSGQLWRPEGQGPQVVWACLRSGMATSGHATCHCSSGSLLSAGGAPRTQSWLSTSGTSMLALNTAFWTVQMGYREYARYLSFHFPFTHERSLLEHLRACPWKFDQRKFKAWRQGRTGGPKGFSSGCLAG